MLFFLLLNQPDDSQHGD